jgi:hypothetical protein
MSYVQPTPPTPAALGLSADGKTVTLDGIAAKVLWDEYQEGIDESGPWREIGYRVGTPRDDPAYVLSGTGSGGDQVDRYLDKLRGSATSSTGAGLAAIVAYPGPHRYPGNPNLYCLNASARPNTALRPDPVKVVNSDLWHIRARYGIPQANNGAYLDVAGEFPEMFIDGYARPWASLTREDLIEEVPVKVDGLQFRTVTTSTPSGGYNIRIPVREYVYTRSQIPDAGLFEYVCQQFEGKLNNAVMWANPGTGFTGFPIGTMLFDRFRFWPEMGPNGVTYFVFELVYKARRFDWNAKNVEGTVNFDIVEDASHNTFHGYGDITVPITWGY